MQITINQKDMSGLYMSNTDCPLARAIKRTIPNVQVEVGGVGGYSGKNMAVLIDDQLYSYNENLWGCKRHMELLESGEELILDLIPIDYNQTMKDHLPDWQMKYYLTE